MRKKRGRPPRVDTPMEARIKAVLKGIRKLKDPGSQLKVRHFERLPDKGTYPDYYMEIKEPVAIDLIKRKSKRKKYQSVDHFMRDMNLMFNNAKAYNQPESQIYRDAVDLQVESRKLAELEKKKPDSEYLMEDGRLPLPDGILYKSEMWKVGDWVHIQNPNDVTKPVVAQIYRTWQDPEGEKWVNACWYYRPEQTVHHYEKHFYPNEVVKTGQYRDHRIEEVIDRCFVMFVTRYNRGRPRGLAPEKDVYVCESRYNEEKHKLNKIKTWASCLPDEVREKDYEMDLFDIPRRIKKIPSPIKHLLNKDAKETDDLPRATWGAENAPPVVGAVHCRPRDENVSSLARPEWKERLTQPRNLHHLSQHHLLPLPSPHLLCHLLLGNHLSVRVLSGRAWIARVTLQWLVFLLCRYVLRPHPLYRFKVLRCLCPPHPTNRQMWHRPRCTNLACKDALALRLQHLVYLTQEPRFLARMQLPRQPRIHHTRQTAWSRSRQCITLTHRAPSKSSN